MQVMLCDVCRNEVKGEEQAAQLCVNPPIPAEVREAALKVKSPMDVVAMGKEKAIHLMKLMAQHESAAVVTHMCGRCTETVVDYVTELQKGMQHKGMVN